MHDGRSVRTPHQAEKADILEQALPVFAGIRSRATRFRGLPRGSDPDAPDHRIGDAMACGTRTIQKSAMTLRHDTGAGRNAICGTWRNGRTEEPINRLKLLKRNV